MALSLPKSSPHGLVGDDFLIQVKCSFAAINSKIDPEDVVLHRVVMWQSRPSHSSSIADMGDGVPYIGLGRKMLECRYEPERHLQQKKKNAVVVSIELIKC